MHVSGFPLDLNWFLQFVVTAFIVAFGLLYLVKNTASKYFVVDANFEPSSPASPDVGERDSTMPGVIETTDVCAVCSKLGKKQCSGCKMVRYCSEACQRAHWNSEHKKKCKDFQLSGRGRRPFTASGTSKILSQSKKILFPYEEFVELFNWGKPGFPPCGLLNCGNSCFANVVLQCLTYTRPLVAYLLEKGHRRECRRNDWCFLCEFQIHMERASQSMQPFSPINILSRLTNIGGNLGYGKQEDAHEFMRFAIDTMQSVCLDEFGGEKAVHPSSQKTTLIQHIFGGHLQSQVVCTKCNNVSNQFENMMDLTVEIQGDAASLEECLDQFTVREQLHGDNMYKCDGCNDYVLAWKRLTIRHAPNILTIALKRFQSGRFGKLNKRVTFPEILDLSPYMSEAGDGSDVYKLYAVVVHVDMLNASYFGHYICYTKDFCGNWYRIDDCKVTRVELDEVLSQGAYMLLYSRVCARPSCLNPFEPSKKEEPDMVQVVQEVVPCTKQSVAESIDTTNVSGSFPSDSSSQSLTEDVKEDLDMVDFEASSSVAKDVEVHANGCSNEVEESVSPTEHAHKMVSGVTTLSVSNVENGNASEKRSAKECVSMDSLIKGSVQIQNHVCEKGEGPHDVSVATINSGEVLDKTNSVNSKGKPEKSKCGKGLQSSSGIEDARGEMEGRNSSGVKLRPLFTPGFLGKHPRDKHTRRDGKAPVELGELSLPCNRNGQSNGFAKSGVSHQNVGKDATKDEEKRHFEYSNSLPSNGLEKRSGKSLNGDQMVSSDSVSLCNGDSAVPVVSDESMNNNNIKDDMSLVIETPSARDVELTSTPVTGVNSID